MIHHEVTYAAIAGFRPLQLDLHVPDGVDQAPVVVWIHGGGFYEGDRRFLPPNLEPGSIFTALTDAGIACATIDYRLTGEDIWPAQREDVLAAIEFLQANADEYRIDATRIGVWGESAGGHLALSAGLMSKDVDVVVAWYPLIDLTAGDPGPASPQASLLGAVPSTEPERAAEASPISHVTASAPPCLLVHGAADPTLPAAQTERMHEALLAAGAESVYHAVPGAGHCFEGHDDMPGLVNEAVAFLAGRL